MKQMGGYDVFFTLPHFGGEFPCDSSISMTHSALFYLPIDFLLCLFVVTGVSRAGITGVHCHAQHVCFAFQGVIVYFL